MFASCSFQALFIWVMVKYHSQRVNGRLCSSKVVCGLLNRGWNFSYTHYLVHCFLTNGRQWGKKESQNNLLTNLFFYPHPWIITWSASLPNPVYRSSLFKARNYCICYWIFQESFFMYKMRKVESYFFSKLNQVKKLNQIFKRKPSTKKEIAFLHLKI